MDLSIPVSRRCWCICRPTRTYEASTYARVCVTTGKQGRIRKRGRNMRPSRMATMACDEGQREAQPIELLSDIQHKGKVLASKRSHTHFYDLFSAITQRRRLSPVAARFAPLGASIRAPTARHQSPLARPSRRVAHSAPRRAGGALTHSCESHEPDAQIMKDSGRVHIRHPNHV